MLTKEIRIEDAHDLRQFMLQMKAWAESHSESGIRGRIMEAESRARSASELILEYEVALKDIRSKFFNRLPGNFQALVEKGQKVANDSVSLESYTRG